jgi:hypothetical protein
VYNSDEDFSNSSMEMRFDEGYRKMRAEELDIQNEILQGISEKSPERK